MEIALSCYERERKGDLYLHEMVMLILDVLILDPNTIVTMDYR